VPSEHLESIDPQKDVDGFHPVNLGRLMAWDTPLRPCTPNGVMAILEDQGVELLGTQALVVGRSIVVGRPMTQLLIKSGATVIVCHRHTQPERLASHVRQADVVVTATGVPKLIKGEWIKPGAVVCDIGITRMPDGSIQGDVDFEPARRRAGAITPVPGGVGPMTIAMLLRNTVVAARLRRGMDPDPEL
jgi:methylenetetrahydrofolate dehydrogenase (NADP+)/methenyltetrahydrofolate cyclohydrolase